MATSVLTLMNRLVMRRSFAAIVDFFHSGGVLACINLYELATSTDLRSPDLIPGGRISARWPHWFLVTDPIQI